MPAYGGRSTRRHIAEAASAALALLLLSVGCIPASTQAVPTATVLLTWGRVVAFGTPPPSAVPRPATRPPPTDTAPLPTFPINPSSSTPLAAKQPKITRTLDPQTELLVWLDWALGPSSRQTTKLRGISYGRYEPGDIVVEWWIDKWWTDPRWWTVEPPDAETLRWTARLDATTILFSIAAGDRIDFTSAVLHGYLLSDSVQRNSDQAVLKISLTYYRSTVDKLDIDALDDQLPGDIYELADRSYIAPEFR